MKIISCERKNGNFKDEKTGNQIDYDNYIFTCLANDQNGMIFGPRYESVKISVKSFNTLCKYQVQDLMNHEVIFEFNKNKPVGIYLLK